MTACKAISTISSNESVGIKSIAYMLLPIAAPITESTITSICEIAFKINDYGANLALGAAIVSLGSLCWELSRCVTIKSKEKLDT